MTPDNLEALSSKLFAAGRDERPASRVRASVLEQAVRARPRAALGLSRSILLAALAAGVVAVIGAGIGTRELSPIAPEQWQAQPSGTNASNRETLPEDIASTRHRTNSRPSQPVQNAEPVPSLGLPAVTTSSRPKLSEEVALLERARTALTSGRSTHALELLEHYQKNLRGSRLQAEATLLRIEALSVAGRSEEAARLAEAFVLANPTSPLVDRAKSFATESGSTSPKGATGAQQ